MNKTIVVLSPIIILALAIVGGSGFAAGLMGQGLLFSMAAAIITGMLALYLYSHNRAAPPSSP